MDLLGTLGSVFTKMISWLGEFTTALFTTEGALSPIAPLFFIGIAVSLIMVAVKIYRKIAWGN